MALQPHLHFVPATKPFGPKGHELAARCQDSCVRHFLDDTGNDFQIAISNGGMGLVWPLVSCLSLAAEGGPLRACCVYTVPSTGFVRGGGSHGGSSPTYEPHAGGAAAHPLCFSTEELHPCPLMIPKCPPERSYEDPYIDGGDPLS